WSPEALPLGSGGVGTAVHVGDAATGQDISRYTGHSRLLADVWAFAWSPDGKRIASACSATSLDKTVHVWNAKTGSGILRYNSSYGLMPNSSVSSVAWAPQGDLIAS